MRHNLSTVLTLLLVSATAAAQDKHTLRYQLAPGPTVWCQTDQDMNMVMKMGEQEMKTSMQTSTWMEGKVVAVKDGTASVEQKYARVKSKSSGMGGNSEYDSDVAGSKPGMMMRDLAKLVGQSATVQMDATGKILAVNIPTGVEAGLEKAGMSLKQTFEQSIMTWPKEPIAVGGTWITEYDMPMGQMGKGKAKVTNKLVGVKDNVATLEQTTELTIDAKGMPPGMKLEVTKATGSAKIDLRAAMPLEMVSDIEMKMQGGADSPMDMTMLMHSAVKQVAAPAAKKADEAPKK
jgi:hypothetical protein